jgi:hypothetical protein
LQTTMYISSDSDEEVQSVRQGRMQVSRAHDAEENKSADQRSERSTHEHTRQMGDSDDTRASEDGSVRLSVDEQGSAGADGGCGEVGQEGASTCSGNDAGAHGAVSDTGNAKSARRPGETGRQTYISRAATCMETCFALSYACLARSHDVH